jgi:predicted site-specific integrase-resolvase
MEFNRVKQTCAIYTRVSTEDQADKYSLSSQVRELRAYAEQHRYDVVTECVDDGYTVVVKDMAVAVTVGRFAEPLGREYRSRRLLPTGFSRC